MHTSNVVCLPTYSSPEGLSKRAARYNVICRFSSLPTDVTSVLIKHLRVQQIVFAIDPILCQKPPEKFDPQGRYVLPDEVVGRVGGIASHRSSVDHTCHQLLVFISEKAQPPIFDICQRDGLQ